MLEIFVLGLIISGVILYGLFCYMIIWTFVAIYFEASDSDSSPIVTSLKMVAILAMLLPFLLIAWFYDRYNYYRHGKKLQKVSD